MTTIVKESPKIPFVSVVKLPIGKGRDDVTWVIPCKRGISADLVMDALIPEYMALDPDLSTKDFTAAQLKSQMRRFINTHHNVQLLKWSDGHVGYRTVHSEVMLKTKQFRLLNKPELKS